MKKEKKCKVEKICSQKDTNNPERIKIERTGICINCGQKINSNMAQCPHCGYCYPNFI